MSANSSNWKPPQFESVGWSSLEHFYSSMPVWIQNLGISVYGLAYRHERLAKQFKSSVEAFRSRDRFTPEQMQSFVENQLRQVLVNAFENVPYYRAAWKAAGFDAADLSSFRLSDLCSLAITPKNELRSRPESFVAEDVRRQHRLRRYYTSGSTGTPITCYLTAETHRRCFAAREARSFGWAGVSIRSPRSTIGGRRILSRSDSGSPYYRYNWAERQVYFSAFHISPQNAANYLEGFNRYRPKVLTGYAHSHFALARIMLQRGLRLDYQPEALVLSSERLTPKMKSVIQEAFQARAYEEYGAVEQCVLATECEKGGLHVNTDFGIVEIIDDNGQPVPLGQEGHIICTGLVNSAQPLIRYDLGDLGSFATELCGCGRDHLPLLKGVVGRLEDAVRTADGRKLVRFHGLFIDVPHLVQAQVIQEGLNFLRIKVIATKGFNEDQERLITERVIERLGDFHVKVECVDELERNEKGKVRAVISRLTEQDLGGTPASETSTGEMAPSR
jgi:phenylacetate-CoA ligase